MASVRFPARSSVRRTNAKILVGWKNVANYLGMGVRTVQRYEREHGLPVRRPAGGARGAVIATAAELDAWVAAAPIRDQFKLAATKVPSSTFAEIQAGMHKMQHLCAEIRQLRNEMRISMDALHSTIHGTVRAGTFSRTEGGFNRLPEKSLTSVRRPN